MKKITRPLSRILRNIFRMLRDGLSSKKRFVRLSPFSQGKIVFFDKKNTRSFSLFSRGEGDSSVLDTIFPKYSYNLEGMLRTEDIYSEYKRIKALGKKTLNY
tara:strand:+ start:619 stop:924 length:306 start_codon:yes stop_codon:yes gene_type:complete